MAKIIYCILLACLLVLSCKDAPPASKTPIVSVPVKSLSKTNPSTTYIAPELSHQVDSVSLTQAGSKTTEKWYKGGNVIHQTQYPSTTTDYRWLVNLDDDAMPEVIRARGEEDGIEHVILDIISNREVAVLHFYPALRDDRYPDKIFWGYPWDMQQPMIKNKELYASISNNYQSDDNIDRPSNQQELPFVFFRGHTTQPDMTLSGIKKPKYWNTQNLRNAVEKRDTPKTENSSVVAEYKGLRLNDDSYTDRIVVYSNPNTNDAYDSKHFSLPVTLYKGTERGETVWKKNDNLIPEVSSTCMAEGFYKIAIKNNFFTIESQYCFDRSITVNSFLTFRCLGESIYLHKYGEQYVDKANPDRDIPDRTWDTQDFGKIRFEEVTQKRLLEIRDAQ